MNVFDWVMVSLGAMGILGFLLSRAYWNGYRAAEKTYEPLIAKVFDNYKALKDAK